MALPKLESSRYTITLPVSKEKVSFRPYLVKEQKILLNAFEQKDGQLISNALHDILTVVTKESIEDKPLADIEYLMLNLRGKSSGEAIELAYTCNNTRKKLKIDPKTKDPILDESGERIYEDATCGAKIEHQLAITEVQVKIQDREDKIMVSDSIGIKLKDIRYSDYRNLKTDEMDRTIENNLKLLTKYIDVIFDNDKVYSDFTEKELLEFIDQLQMKDLEKIYDYIEKAPRLEHTIELVCPVCGHKETIKLQGLDDFLM